MPKNFAKNPAYRIQSFFPYQLGIGRWKLVNEPRHLVTSTLLYKESTSKTVFEPESDFLFSTKFLTILHTHSAMLEKMLRHFVKKGKPPTVFMQVPVPL
jgi:hypothetical protein